MDPQELDTYECLVENVIVETVLVEAADEDEAESLVYDGKGEVVARETESSRIVVGPSRKVA